MNTYVLCIYTHLAFKTKKINIGYIN